VFCGFLDPLFSTEENQSHDQKWKVNCIPSQILILLVEQKHVMGGMFHFIRIACLFYMVSLLCLKSPVQGWLPENQKMHLVMSGVPSTGNELVA
jgi:hypothetical protein